MTGRLRVYISWNVCLMCQSVRNFSLLAEVETTQSRNLYTMTVGLTLLPGQRRARRVIGSSEPNPRSRPLPPPSSSASLASSSSWFTAAVAIYQGRWKRKQKWEGWFIHIRQGAELIILPSPRIQRRHNIWDNFSVCLFQRQRKRIKGAPCHGAVLSILWGTIQCIPSLIKLGLKLFID